MGLSLFLRKLARGLVLLDEGFCFRQAAFHVFGLKRVAQFTELYPVQNVGRRVLLAGVDFMSATVKLSLRRTSSEMPSAFQVYQRIAAPRMPVNT